MGILNFGRTLDSSAVNSLPPEIRAAAKGNVMLAAAIVNAQRHKTDLLEAEYTVPASAEEAIYRGRIYSITGKDPNFPKLPLKIIEMDMILSPYRFKRDIPKGCAKKDAVSYSNRPWADDRSEEEKNKYENIVEIRTRSAYRWVCEKLPDLAPASFDVYKIMKNDNAEEYCQLQETAYKMGRRI